MSICRGLLDASITIFLYLSIKVKFFKKYVYLFDYIIKLNTLIITSYACNHICNSRSSASSVALSMLVDVYREQFMNINERVEYISQRFTSCFSSRQTEVQSNGSILQRTFIIYYRYISYLSVVENFKMEHLDQVAYHMKVLQLHILKQF